MSIPIPEKRIADFENLGFGMFIHWGLYSQLQRGEWIMFKAKYPKEEYRKLANTFKPEEFVPKKWVALAKSIGMKYIVLTTRHHEGFSLYDTCGLNDYDAPHYCGRDLVREFVDACNEGGIIPFFYHTTLDWDNELFENDFPAYLQYLRDSVEILCSNYGKIGGLWFDGNWSKPADTDWEEDKLYEVIRRHQPDAIIVNNTGIGARGEVGNLQLDSVTFEQGRPTPMDREGHKKYVAAEMCDTLNDTWGIGVSDLNYKSIPTLIETLCSCRKVGANYLLNIGPEADGNIYPLQKLMLENVGTWVNTCGQCIYHGRPSRITVSGDKNFILEGDGKAYAFIHDVKLGCFDDQLFYEGEEDYKRVEGLTRKVKSVKWTDNGEDVPFTQGDGSIDINATFYRYAVNYVVRVAEIEFED